MLAVIVRARLAGLAVGVVAVAGDDVLAGVGRKEDAAERVAEHTLVACCCLTAQQLVDSRPGDQVGFDGSAAAVSIQFLHEVGAVVQVAGAVGADGFADAAAQGRRTGVG